MPTTVEQANLTTACRYLELIENFAPPAELEEILHSDVSLEEYPNLLMPTGSKRDFAGMSIGPQQGRKILTTNRYEIMNAFAAGDWVTLEIVWTGTLAIPLGSMAAGTELKAYIATFLQFKEGKIITQHQYDCYEPFPVS
ncbi:MAG: nuclear transport factor 2 family protein [Caldilineaceae bacterium]|nr:nuclear transport factor 2 family protein [Caldilineaceae bacterium]